MPRVLTEARSMCRELVDAFKEMDTLAYTSRYDTVFSDFIDWLVYQHQFPPTDKNPIEKYNKEEQERFLKIYQNIQKEVRNRTMLWSSETSPPPSFYDPLGRMYETITSKYKSSMLGQYFTPSNVVEMMTKISGIGNNRKEFIRMLDPACGSGRMGLSAAAHAMKKGSPIWVTMNDIDPICTKMTAVNMALNGVVGEAICMDGLDITNESFRFAYKVTPLYLYLPEETRDLHRIAMLAKTRQDIKKQYVLTSLEYEQTYLSQVNNEVLRRLGEARQSKSQEEQKIKEKAIKDEIQARLKNSLFENDTSIIHDIKLPSEIITNKNFSKKPNLKKTKPSGEQGSLF